MIHGVGPPVGSLPMQVVDPAAIQGLSPTDRGVVAFAAVLVLGAGLAWGRWPLVERSIAASTGHPLASLAYGLAAHAVIALGGIYLVARLTRLEGVGVNAGVLAAVAGAFAVLLAAGLGFTVVGTIAADVAGVKTRFVGSTLGAVIAGAAATVEPLLGALVWFVVVSTGIGGVVREWVHASTGPDS